MEHDELDHENETDEHVVHHDEGLFIGEFEQVGERVSCVEVGDELHLLCKPQQNQREREFGSLENSLFLELKGIRHGVEQQHNVVVHNAENHIILECWLSGVLVLKQKFVVV